ncbi:hypothetical protein ACQB60_06215 [Actinomycetota bacterium Odt1-20B]
MTISPPGQVHAQEKGSQSQACRYKKPDGTWGSQPGFPTKTTTENWGDEQEAAIRAGR